ncbi:hypothetical protein XELAEV_18000391mg [Xenopus laevis]|uniref:Uncharacterized protein n=1 Tax=Xenopus laevis TaxID=8355 RepID=A0A974GZ67_XENLA|nr:hypothetical protein XELAEV_18000391mg [Xenopus laevis]
MPILRTSNQRQLTEENINKETKTSYLSSPSSLLEGAPPLLHFMPPGGLSQASSGEGGITTFCKKPLKKKERHVYLGVPKVREGSWSFRGAC